jgi:mannose-6-phosphate isomerase-like protein (cupin superfamily)
MRVASALVCAAFSIHAASAARAQTPAPPSASTPQLTHAVQILTTTQLAAVADSLPAGASTSHPMMRWEGEGLSTMMSRRDTSGVPERHEQFTDIFVVERGRARLVYGGSAVGERASSPGEWRGGTIRGGTEAEIKPGEVVVIPAGIPHQLLLPPGESFYYFVFKVAKPAAK